MKKVYLIILTVFVFLLGIFSCILGVNFYKNANMKKVENVVNDEFNSRFEFEADYYSGIKNPKQKELRILVLGNSISSGVIVSDIKDDYINVLIRKISSMQNNRYVHAKVRNLANFERHYDSYNYSVLQPLLAFKPDIIIFQLGENYNRDNDDLYFRQFVKLIQFFGKENVRIVTSPYWGQKNKNKINEQAALDTDSFYVDLSNLFMYDKKTRADYKKKFANVALGLHPGEYGMKRIAEEIFILINALICMKIL